MRILVIGLSREFLEYLREFRHIDRNLEIHVADEDRRHVEEISREFDIPSYVGNLTNYYFYSRDIDISRFDVVVVNHREVSKNIAACLIARYFGVRVVSILDDHNIGEILKKAGVIDTYIIGSKAISEKLSSELYGFDYISIPGGGYIVNIDTARHRNLIGKKIGELFEEEAEFKPVLVVKDTGKLVLNISIDYLLEAGDKLIVYTKKLSRIREILVS